MMSILTQDKFSEQEMEIFLKNIDNPVLITFVNPKNEFPMSVPIWTLYANSKFYIMGGKKSLRVKAIKLGYQKFGLNIVNTDSYPHIQKNSIPYLLVTGTARIVQGTDNLEFSHVEIKLLEKYNQVNAEKWALDRIELLKETPSDSWMIEITPEASYIYPS